MRATARYNQWFPSDRMTRADGYALLPSGSLPDTPEILLDTSSTPLARFVAISASAFSLPW